MVRSYLRHEPTQAFGVICSNTAKAILDPDGKTAYVPALEDVLVWDVRTGQQLGMWHEVGHRSPVTALARCPAASSSHLFAAGYEDGSVRLWDSNTAESLLTFNGHTRSVAALTFDESGLLLASGSQDTSIIVWDLVAEKGLFRFKGHRDLITDLAFINYTPSQEGRSAPSSSALTANAAGYLLSTSKDGLLKVWDLALQHCIETVVPGKGELWSIAALPIPQETEDGDVSPKQDSLIITGSADGEARLWLLKGDVLALDLAEREGLTAEGDSSGIVIPQGQLDLISKRRVTQIAFSQTRKGQQPYLGISSSDRSVQIFRLREEEEMRKKLARRKRRQKEKAGKKGAKVDEEDDDALDGSEEVTWPERIEPYTMLRPEAGRVRSFAFPSGPAQSTNSSNKTAAHAAVPILCATNGNSLEVHSIPAPPKGKAEKRTGPVEPVLACALDLPGHRSEVRALALSSDDSLLASADSQGSLKVWNVKTGRCIRTLPCGYALTLKWLPGDRYVIVGCKDGTIRTYDVPAGENVETIEAHAGPVWSITLHPDGLQCVSASADKDVKFWEFEMRSKAQEGEDEDEEESEGSDVEMSNGRPAKSAGPQQLALAHTRTLKMTDDVLFACFSPNGKLLALSLLDNTVKIFYSDSLKFFLSLYGHKLPVLSLDISGDSKLCVTVSADKNIKLWGLDFGDCHKSIFGHQDSIMAVAFEKGMQGGGLMGGREGESHHFWTIGKDGLLKYWDGDRFELIQTMEGHHGEIWSLAVGAKGDLVVSSGADRSLRIWEKTEEPLFLEEEREKEQERLFEEADREARAREETQVGAVGSLAGGESANGQTAEGVEGSSTAVTNATNETLMAGERLMEALDLADDDANQRREWIASGRKGPAPPRNTIIMAQLEKATFPIIKTSSASTNGKSASSQASSEIEDFLLPSLSVLSTLTRIPATQLDDSLLTLPYDRVLSLFSHVSLWLSPTHSATSSSSLPIPLISHVLFFLLRSHHAQISTTASPSLRRTLLTIAKGMRAALKRNRNVTGYNLVALRQVRKRCQEEKMAEIAEDLLLGAASVGNGRVVAGDAAEAEVTFGNSRKRKVDIQ